MARPQYDPGNYLGRITRQRLGKTSKGNAQLVIGFQVLGKINPADPEGNLLACPQQERTVFRAITDATKDWVLRIIDAIGWYGTRWEQFDEGDSCFCSILEKEVVFYCKHEPHYETGEPREVWDVALSGGGPEVQPLDDKGLRQLNAMFGRALQDRKPPKVPEKTCQTVQPPAQTTAGAVDSDANTAFAEAAVEPADDIPF